FGVIEHREVGTPGLGAARQLGAVGVAVEPVVRAVLAVVEGLLAHRLLIGAGVGRGIGARLAIGVLLGAFGRVLVALGLIRRLFVVVALIELVGEVESGEQVPRQ